MLLRNLLDVPALRLRRLAGDDEEWDRPVRWVYTTDLIDPGRYLSGGELVLTGLVWRRGPEDSERFVSTVAAAGAVGLAAGDAVFGSVPPDVVEACERHRLPLLAVPEEVSFRTLTEHVLAAVATARGDRLAATVSRQRQLLAAVAQGRGVDDLAAQASAAIGRRCRVLTASGRVLADGEPQMLPGDVDRLTATFLCSERLPAVTGPDVPPRVSVFGVGPALGLRVTSWFVAVDGEWPEWSPEALEVVGELSAIAAVERTMRDEVARVGRRLAEDTVRAVVAGAPGQPDTAARLRQVGLDPDRPLAVAVAALTHGAVDPEVARSLLEDVASHLGTPVVASSPDAEVVALLPATDQDFADVVGRAVRRLEPGLERARFSVGVSRPSSAAALSGALEEARYARRLAELRPGRAGVVTSDEVTSHVMLLATVPDDVRRAFAARLLGPVLAHDTRHRGDLQRTLRVFLDSSGSWSRCAEVLGVHVNTVRYRIGRVEDLTGRDLSRLDDVVDVLLALRSL